MNLDKAIICIFASYLFYKSFSYLLLNLAKSCVYSMFFSNFATILCKNVSNLI